MRAWADAVVAVVRRDAFVYLTYRTQLLTRVAGLVFNLTIFYFVSQLLRSRSFGGGPEAYFAYVVVGLTIMQVLVTTLGLTPMQVRQELVAGTLERFLVSPFGIVNGMIAMMIFPIAFAMLTSVIMLALAAAIFSLHLAATAPLAIPVAVLGAVAFMPFSLFLIAAIVAFKQLSAATEFVVSGVAIAGGLFFPVALLPNWLRWTSEVQPFTPAADLLRHLLVDSPLHQGAGIELLKLVAFGIALLPVSIAVLRLSVRYGKRSGTIIEY